MVILLDALGASGYTEDQIKMFLSSRARINHWISTLAKSIRGIGNFKQPTIFTFADTIIITIQLSSKKHMDDHIWIASLLMRRYLFHSMEEGILFRGAFSIGHYIEDADSNTVMGEAVTDAAAWYDRSEWIGLSSTPRTNSVLEYHLIPGRDESSLGFLSKYDVPLKEGTTFSLYAVTWPSAFFDSTLLKRAKKNHPRKYFLEILKDLDVPKGSEIKYENAKHYFDFIEKKKASEELRKAHKKSR